MIQTLLYRNRKLKIDFTHLQVIPQGIGAYGDRQYSTTVFHLQNLCITENDQPLITIPSVQVGKRSDRFESWTAWDKQLSIGLCGDFIFLITTHGEIMDSSADTYKMGIVAVVDPRSFDSQTPIEEQAIIIQEYEYKVDESQKEFRLFHMLSGLVSINTGFIYEYNLRKYCSQSKEGIEELPPYTYEHDFNQLPSCGGAARVSYQNQFRWLLPHEEGPAAAVERLKNTTHVDDWSLIQPHLVEATEAEKHRVWSHFMRFGTREVQDSMKGLFAQNNWEPPTEKESPKDDAAE